MARGITCQPMSALFILNEKKKKHSHANHAVYITSVHTEEKEEADE